MSTRILVIPEDDNHDQHFLRPFFEAMFASIGKPRAVIRVCQNPRLGGVNEALKEARIREVIGMNPMIDLFLLIVDRDGEENRCLQLRRLEECAARSPRKADLIAENAWQEVEVWLLAGMEDLPKDWTLQVLRAERDAKEVFFLPFAKIRGVLSGPDQGRRKLGPEAADHYGLIRARCPEVAELEARIAAWLASRNS